MTVNNRYLSILLTILFIYLLRHYTEMASIYDSKVLEIVFVSMSSINLKSNYLERRTPNVHEDSR